VGETKDLLSRGEMTQITSEKLSPATIERIKTVIYESENKKVLNISAPSDKLETFFIRIVREAEQRKQTTSGAASGGALPGFFGARAAAESGSELIESLVAAGRKGETPEGPSKAGPSELPAPKPERAVIEQLVSGPAPIRPPPAETDAAEKAPTIAAPAPPADQGVIDALLGKARDNDKD
jgi:hypothetical protein